MNLVLIVYLAFIIFVVGTIAFYGVKWYHFKHPKTIYISIEEVTKLVENAMFWDLVTKIASDKKATCDGENLNDTGYVTILQSCENNSCPCHESREDCCNTDVEIDGKRYCKILVDINKLCGLPSVKEKPDVSKLLTDEECKLLAKSIVEYMEQQQ